MNAVYEIMVRGATRSTINSHVILGDFSVPAKVLVTRDCDKIPPLMRRSSKELSAGVIAGMVCACFAVMLAITSFVLWKYVAFHARHVSRDDPTSDSIIERYFRASTRAIQGEPLRGSLRIRASCASIIPRASIIRSRLSGHLRRLSSV
jgi:hypothetical protein